MYYNKRGTHTHTTLANNVLPIHIQLKSIMKILQFICLFTPLSRKNERLQLRYLLMVGSYRIYLHYLSFELVIGNQ